MRRMLAAAAAALLLTGCEAVPPENGQLPRMRTPAVLQRRLTQQPYYYRETGADGRETVWLVTFTGSGHYSESGCEKNGIPLCAYTAEHWDAPLIRFGSYETPSGTELTRTQQYAADLDAPDGSDAVAVQHFTAAEDGTLQSDTGCRLIPGTPWPELALAGDEPTETLRTQAETAFWKVTAENGAKLTGKPTKSGVTVQITDPGTAPGDVTVRCGGFTVGQGTVCRLRFRYRIRVWVPGKKGAKLPPDQKGYDVTAHCGQFTLADQITAPARVVQSDALTDVDMTFVMPENSGEELSFCFQAGGLGFGGTDGLRAEAVITNFSLERMN